MADPILVTFLLFGGMLFFLALGVPIAFALGGLSVGLIYTLWSPMGLSMMPLRAYSSTASFEYLAIPLFIFMACMLQRARIADDLYNAMERIFGSFRGGLAIGTVVICTVFAAMSGISGAATVAMGMIAIPAMLSRGYGKDMALGTIAAGGSLGILIPPSVTMIIYGLVANTSIGRLYAGGLIPGLILAFLFSLYLALRGRLQPELAGGSEIVTYTWQEKISGLKGLIFPIFLVAAVLGSILTGFASISESAAVGAVGAVLSAAILGRLNWKIVTEACHETLYLSCMIFWIIIGASTLSTFYTGMGAGRVIESFVLDLEVNRWVILIVMQLLLLVLGMVLESTGIIMITAPIFVPIIIKLGFDPIWFGVLFIINMEIGFLSPPFGYNLFYLRGVAPKSVTMVDIYLSVIPFIILMLFAMGLFMVFPGIITYLPDKIF